jgi:ribonuclease HII
VAARTHSPASSAPAGRKSNTAPRAKPGPAPKHPVRAETPTVGIERLLWDADLSLVAGIDEAGRGAWAGPVVAAAVVLRPEGHQDLFDCVRDSKQLTARERTAASVVIRSEALAWGVSVIPASVVDETGLSFAGQLAFWRAVKALPLRPEYLLVDGFPLWSGTYCQTAVFQGDQRSLSIAAASVLAKVTRDQLMSGLEDAPGTYGFAINKGYGSRTHREALRTFGPSEHHRRSYAPVAEVCAELGLPWARHQWSDGQPGDELPFD